MEQTLMIWEGNEGGQEGISSNSLSFFKNDFLFF